MANELEDTEDLPESRAGSTADAVAGARDDLGVAAGIGADFLCFYSRHAPDGVYLEVSPTCRVLLGYEPEELVGTSAYDYFHPADLAAIADSHVRVVSTPDAATVTYRIRHKQGHFAWFQTTSQNVRDDQTGQVTEITCVSYPARGPGELAQSVRASEERFRPLTEAATDMIWVLGADASTVEFVNSLVERTLGLSHEALHGRAFFELVHPDDGEAVSGAFDGLISRPGMPAPIEMRLAHADGSWREFAAIVINRLDDPSIGGIVISAHDITARHQLETQLRRASRYDPLTGLPNQSMFLESVGEALSRRDGSSGTVAVLYIDLDGFRAVNDNLGHQGGDRLLAAVAERLRRMLGDHENAGRLSGDEFAVLCEQVLHPDAAIEAAERVSAELVSPFDLDGQDVFLSASIGIALAGQSGESPESLLQSAHIALHEAKTRGTGNRYEVFDESLHVRAAIQMRTNNELRSALERGELRVFYQPLVTLSSGLVAGFEALVRWQHPKRGLLAPAHFIPLAEESGLIIPIGGWVLRESCNQAARWREAHPEGRPLVMSVNVSVRQLGEERLVETVADALALTGTPPSQLCLEVTETALMQDPVAAGRTLAALHDLGVRLAIDDFGTGYSSLAYLKRFPIQTVKIDQSFVAGLGRDPDDSAIVAAITSMAHALGLTAVGEGVETAEQLAGLRAVRCDYAQGYYYARPLPADAADHLLEPEACTEGMPT